MKPHTRPSYADGSRVLGSVYPMQWMRLMMICCGMAVKRMGMLGVSVR